MKKDGIKDAVFFLWLLAVERCTNNNQQDEKYYDQSKAVAFVVATAIITSAVVVTTVTASAETAESVTHSVSPPKAYTLLYGAERKEV